MLCGLMSQGICESTATGMFQAVGSSGPNQNGLESMEHRAECDKKFGVKTFQDELVRLLSDIIRHPSSPTLCSASLRMSREPQRRPAWSQCVPGAQAAHVVPTGSRGPCLPGALC